MQPENWIKSRVRDKTHVSSISHHDVNCIMDSLQTPITAVTAISIVRKWPVIGFLGNELIGQNMQPAAD